MNHEVSAQRASVPPGVAAGSPLLELRGIRKAFGGLVVADDVSMSLDVGQVRALIGPNGAGKSTLIDLITGFQPADAGTVRLGPQRLDGWDPSRRRAAGIARTFQTARVFESSTVFDNVLLASRFQRTTRELFRRTSPSSVESDDVEAALDLVGMRDRSYHLAAELPHGLKRLLEIAMAVVVRPQVLLLDEPAAGLSVRETSDVAGIIDRLRGEVAMLVVDHDMAFIRALDAPVTVLHRGRVAREGSIDVLRADPFMHEIYLGVPDDVAT